MPWWHAFSKCVDNYFTFVMLRALNGWTLTNASEREGEGRGRTGTGAGVFSGENGTLNDLRLLTAVWKSGKYNPQ